MSKLMSKFRIPRKSKKVIPKGMYCYEPIVNKKGEIIFFKNKEGLSYYKTKPCKFISDHPEYPDDNITSYCKLLKCDVEDMCKSCGIKY